MRRGLGVAVAVLMAGFATAALADGDAAKGAKVFNKCKACHTLEAGVNRVGPSLHGIFGRKAGTAAGYNYSKALAGAGFTWDEDHLKHWLQNPKTFLKGNKMTFPGLKKEDDIENLIAYLHQAAGNAQ